MEVLESLTLVAAAVAVAAAAYSARSWPIGVRRRVQTLQERVDAAEATVEAMQGKWHATSAELAAFLEEAEGVLSSVEKKRRRIAASESAAKGRNGEGLGADPGQRRDQLMNLARERGFRV